MIKRKTLKLVLYPLIVIVFSIALSGCTAQPTGTIDSKTNVEEAKTEQSVVQETKEPDTQTVLTKTETDPAKATEQPQNELYDVASVTDGDTIKVYINSETETVRLIGMDTPETVDPRKPVQCFGKEASNKAKEILNGKKVRLEADSTQGEWDKYDRLLRYVYLEDGTFYNKWMIAEGYAHEYTYDSNPYKYQDDFKEAEKQAREQSKGFWGTSTCNGDTTTSADSTAVTSSQPTPTANQPAATTTPASTDGPQVKKSTSGICHEKGVSQYYNQTKNYTTYDSTEECLASGGRLPK